MDNDIFIVNWIWWMDITHPEQQLIFYFDVFVEFILYLFHSAFHILESILFHNFDKSKQKHDRSVKHNTNNTCENGDKCARIWERKEVKCAHMFEYTYAGIRIKNINIEKQDRHMSRVMRTDFQNQSLCTHGSTISNITCFEQAIFVLLLEAWTPPGGWSLVYYREPIAEPLLW